MKWLKNNLVYLLGFLFPFVILVTIFVNNKVVPFGDNIYLRSDMYHQYAPFYKELYDKLVNGGSFTFSWEIGMGVNFSAIYSYYLASPVNLLLGLLPERGILIAMDVIILVSTGLAGFSCTYYLSKHFHVKNMTAAAFGIFYALSSYMAAFSWNIMWLNCMILLPFIALGLEALVKEKKFKLYTIALGLAIFSNYYIAIMLCLFAVLYFAMLLAVHANGEKGYVISRLVRFTVSSLIAGGIGATMILPELCALGYTASSEFEFPKMWMNYFSLLEMMYRSLIEVPVAIFEAHDPNVYCTVGIFLWFPLYCICSKVDKREKVGKLILIALMLFSFNTNIPNYIWHGFHFPNSLPARESFIYIFLMVTILFEAFLYAKEYTEKQLYGCFAGALAVIFLLEELFEDKVKFENIYISLAFVSLYFMLMILIKKEFLFRKIGIYMLCVLCIAEAYLNSGEESSYKPTTYSAYLDDNKAIENLVEKVKKQDQDFYRMEKLVRRTKNDAAWNGYKGVSVFSSMANASVTEYLGALGFEESTNSYAYYGFTPLTSALLDVKYVFSDTVQDDVDRYTLTGFEESDNLYLYRVNQCLPLGFMVPKEVLELSIDGNNPFAVQNSFVDLTTDETEIFHYIPAVSKTEEVTIQLEEDSDLYVYVVSGVENLSYSAYNEEKAFADSDTFSGIGHRRILHFGEMPEGTTVTVTSSDENVSNIQLYAYAFDKDAFDKAYQELSSQPMTDITYDDNHVKGSVDAKEDGILYTSIVYDKGWTVYIDGVRSVYKSMKGAFLAVPVNKGSHTIEFRYYPEGKTLGRIITIVSVLLLCFLIFADSKIQKKKKLEQANELIEELQESEKQKDKENVKGEEIEENQVTQEIVEALRKEKDS